jgi:hypothetical protein
MIGPSPIIEVELIGSTGVCRRVKIDVLIRVDVELNENVNIEQETQYPDEPWRARRPSE